MFPQHNVNLIKRTTKPVLFILVLAYSPLPLPPPPQVSGKVDRSRYIGFLALSLPLTRGSVCILGRSICSLQSSFFTFWLSLYRGTFCCNVLRSEIATCL